MPEPSYQTFDYELQSKGLVARYIQDDAPQYSYLNLDSWEVRQENAMSSRLGPMMITTNGTNNTPLTDTNVHTLRRLKGIGATWRYAGAGQNLYRRAGDTNGGYTQINSVALSGSRFSAEVYRPNLSSAPYLFIADSGQMLKDNGAGNASKWGGLPPLVPPTTAITGDPTLNVVTIGAKVVIGSYTTVNVGGFANGSRVNTTIGTVIAAGTLATATPGAMTNIVPGMYLVIPSGVHTDNVYVLSTTATTFTAFFSFSHVVTDAVTNGFVTGTVAANTTAQIQASPAPFPTFFSVGSHDNDLISLFINIDNPANLQQIQVMFDVSDGSFTKSYYTKIVTPDSLQPVVSGNVTGPSGVVRRVFDRAGGVVDTRQAGVEFVPLLPGDDPSLTDIQPAPLKRGLSQWSNLQLRLGDFLKVGQAGNVGFDWSAVVKAQVTFQTIATAGIVVGLDDWAMIGGSSLDTLGGIAYDWRITFYNNNTGYETNPSITQIPSLGLLPRRQSVQVNWVDPTDPQFTHVRVYRRGGSLSVGWNLCATVAVGVGQFVDGLSDESISTNKTLELDNDPPVTATLPVPAVGTLGTIVTAGSLQSFTPSSGNGVVTGALMTVGTGDNQETVYIQSTSFVPSFHGFAYFQYAHSAADPIQITTTPNQACNLMAIGFDRAWVAGDPNNPHILYYSKRFNPESFPPQNTLEIGKPDDPIMGIVNFRGLIYVFTLSKIYSVFSPGGSTPIPYDTAETTYGLVSNFGFCVGNGEIKYQSKDGIRRFRGGASELMTLNQDWIFNGQNLGPIAPADKTKFNLTLMAYHNRQMFVSYVDINGNRKRLIWDDAYQRFRNDSILANAIYVEQDTNLLLYSDASGSIFEDRVNNFDDGGFSAGVQIKNAIPLSLQLPYLDQGKPKFQKNYNEFTIKLDTQGETVSLTLKFDDGNGATVVLSNAISCTGLTPFQFKLNAGQGQLAFNVSLLITGNVKNVVTVKELAFKAAIETDKRQSVDTYWRDSGTNEWQLIKQGWFKYLAADAGGVTVNIYKDGNLTTPVFSFVLPQTSVRQPLRVRFKPIKCRVYRVIATSASDFYWYDDSHLEVKPLSGNKGYQRAKVA